MTENCLEARHGKGSRGGVLMGLSEDGNAELNRKDDEALELKLGARTIKERGYK